MNGDPFWFVWNVNGGAPSCMHASPESAITEAQRLARLNRGETFVVLQTLCAFRTVDLERIDMRPGPADEIPF